MNAKAFGRVWNGSVEERFIVLYKYLHNCHFMNRYSRWRNYINCLKLNGGDLHKISMNILEDCRKEKTKKLELQDEIICMSSTPNVFISR